MVTIDRATFLDGLQTSSRVLTFPDGVSRHITLRNACWSTADQMAADNEWPADAWPTIVWNALQNYLRDFPDEGQDFELSLRLGFEWSLLEAAKMQYAAPAT